MSVENLKLLGISLYFLVCCGSAASYEATGVDLAPTIDEILSKADQNGLSSTAIKSGGLAVEGDMLLDPLQYALAYTNLSTLAGAAIKGDKRRWPKAIIPYKFHSDFSWQNKDRIKKAMREWEDRTCINFMVSGRFTQKLVGHIYDLLILNKDGCWSRVGYSWGGSCSLAIRGCLSHETILHELGHAIGLHHEQSRTDRDKYVKIISENIEKGKGSQFMIETQTQNYSVPYDYCSIMHYGPNYFAKKYFTMVTRDLDYLWTIGRVKNLSFTDVKVVNLMYNCNKDCQPQADCKEPCYVNHKCQCECAKEECKKHPCRERSSETHCRIAESYLRN